MNMKIGLVKIILVLSILILGVSVVPALAQSTLDECAPSLSVNSISLPIAVPNLSGINGWALKDNTLVMTYLTNSGQNGITRFDIRTGARIGTSTVTNLPESGFSRTIITPNGKYYLNGSNGLHVVDTSNSQFGRFTTRTDDRLKRLRAITLSTSGQFAYAVQGSTAIPSTPSGLIKIGIQSIDSGASTLDVQSVPFSTPEPFAVQAIIINDSDQVLVALAGRKLLFVPLNANGSIPARSTWMTLLPEDLGLRTFGRLPPYFYSIGKGKSGDRLVVTGYEQFDDSAGRRTYTSHWFEVAYTGQVLNHQYMQFRNQISPGSEFEVSPLRNIALTADGSIYDLTDSSGYLRYKDSFVPPYTFGNSAKHIMFSPNGSSAVVMDHASHTYATIVNGFTQDITVKFANGVPPGAGYYFFSAQPYPITICTPDPSTSIALLVSTSDTHNVTLEDGRVLPYDAASGVLSLRVVGETGPDGIAHLELESSTTQTLYYTPITYVGSLEDIRTGSHENIRSIGERFGVNYR